MEILLLWNQINNLWCQIQDSNGVYMMWDDIYLIEEVSRVMRGGGTDAYEEYVAGNPWPKLSEQIGKEKTERFIKIFCTVNNIGYENMIKIKEGEDIKVSVSQFEKVFNESIRIKVDFEN